MLSSIDSKGFESISLINSFELKDKKNETESLQTKPKIPFKDRSNSYKAAFIAGCIIGFPAIGAYYSYTHSKGTFTEIANKVIKIASALPEQINQAIVKPMMHAATAAKNWTVKHVLNPLSIKINIVAAFILITFPDWFQDKVILPIKFISNLAIQLIDENVIQPLALIAAVAKEIITKTLPQYISNLAAKARAWTYEKILQPLEKIIHEISKVISTTIKPFVMQKIIQPMHAIYILAKEVITKKIPGIIHQAYTNTKIWANDHILVPLTQALQKISLAVFVELPKIINSSIIKPFQHAVSIASQWTQNHVLNPVLKISEAILKHIQHLVTKAKMWTHEKIIQPLQESIQAVSKFLLETAKPFIMKNIVIPFVDGFNFSADWIKSNVISPAAQAINAVYRMTFITIPSVLFQSYKSITNWTYHSLYIPFLDKINATMKILIDAGILIKEKLLKPIGRGIWDGVKWTHNKILCPIGREIVSIAKQVFFAAKFTKIWLSNHIIAPIATKLIEVAQIIRSIPGLFLVNVLIPMHQHMTLAANWTMENVLNPLRNKIKELVQEYLVDLPREMYKQSILAIHQGIKWTREEVLSPLQHTLKELYQTIIVETAKMIKETMIDPIKAELSNFKDEVVEAVFETIEKVKTAYHNRFNNKTVKVVGKFA